jgi:sugar phosphate isomerase/epimerase
LQRAEELGAKAIVFGSPGSRSIPDGFSVGKAREQMITFCRLCSDVIREHSLGMRIAVEHVNHTETNHINTFAQALDLVREIDRPEIGLAADSYHFAMEDEDSQIMLEAADLICAVQVADPRDRCFPVREDEVPGLRKFLGELADIGYQGGVSVEANLRGDLEVDCRKALEALKALAE